MVVYASLGAGLVKRRGSSAVVGGHSTAAGTFRELESALKSSFPDLPEGFTMREGLARARGAEPKLNWEEIERSLRAYEAHRYGDAALPSEQQAELERLIDALRRGRGVRA